MPSTPRQLSVVVGTVDCERTIRGSLQAMLSSCAGLDAEVIVADGSHDATAEIVAAEFPQVSLLRGAAGALVPELWASGLRAARGEVVAFTIGQCAPRPGWAKTLLAAVKREGVAGAGGEFSLAPGAGNIDRAVFLLRYSAFLAGGIQSSVVNDVAADNAAYARDVLLRHETAWRDGFWEVEFHRRLTPTDGRLLVTTDAVVEFRAGAGLGAYVRQRFEHGRHFGAWRVRAGRQLVLRVVAAAPLVPVVLLSRIARRAAKAGAGRTLLLALPALLVLSIAWAAGEAVGALTARPGPTEGRGRR